MAQRLKLGLCKAIATTLHSCTWTDTTSDDPKPPAAVVSDFEWRKDDKWHDVVCNSDAAGRRRRRRRRRRSRRIQAEAPARLSVFKKLIPCAVDGKVKESFAVVKRSEDPYEDFKSSMMEMVLEKQMFEQRDLEQLLHCFLSLNSRSYHAIIVQAFSHIWDTIFNY